jgi:hypothetical protein
LATTTPPPSWCDPVTDRVVGARAWRSRLDPDSRAARDLAARPVPIPHDAWAAERDALCHAQRWLESAAPEALGAARAALAALPDLDPARRRAEAGEPWREADLFALKRFALGAHALSDLMRALLPGEPGPRRAWLDGLLDTLHPEARRTSRFRLADALSPELASARAAWRASRRALRRRRAATEDALRADYPGARVELDGALTLPDDQVARAGEDPRLEPRGGRWAPTDAELARLEAAHADDQAALDAAEGAARAALTDALSPELDALDALEAALAAADLRLAKARLRAAADGCWPELADADLTFSLTQGADPRIEGAQRVDADAPRAPVVVTGPNMGGKSSLLKLVGLCHWCAAHLYPAPARRVALARVEGCVYVGADADADDAPGLSSFGREIRRVVDARAGTPAPRIWLLDELGRGTHPEEGADLARDLVAMLHAEGDAVWLATHFPGAADLPGALRLRIAGLVHDDALAELATVPPEQMSTALRAAMDYRPRVASPGDPIPRDARRIARLLGLDLDPTA